ncbi:MAG: GTPase HflX [Candidatus Pacebacteria bacterium]|nr:GTPase HflX [Candidatus Paceibacterota bacterium]
MEKTNKIIQPKFLIIQVVPKLNDEDEIERNIDETKQLIKTYGGQIIETIIQKRNHPDPNLYIGAGKVEELLDVCDHNSIDIVVINDLVKSSQIFRIEKELWAISPKIMVWDRIDLILNIFDQHATTVESKLQIKLARATHMGPRIYGLGKTELSRQGGGVGTRGKGETNIEFERRQIKVDQQKIKKELKKLLKQKKNRLQKRNEMGIGPVALVGYTSAGKTTLFNALTGKEKEMNKGLFTTLDTVVGKMKSPNFKQPILISDTIGFINNLPPVLIDSFKSTLLESLEAKLLLHVVDANDPQVMEKITVVEEIIDTLDANQPRNIVLNKIDLVDKDKLDKLEEQIKEYFTESEKIDKLRSIQRVSAESGEKLETLKGNISQFFKVIED